MPGIKAGQSVGGNEMHKSMGTVFFGCLFCFESGL